MSSEFPRPPASMGRSQRLYRSRRALARCAMCAVASAVIYIAFRASQNATHVVVQPVIDPMVPKGSTADNTTALRSVGASNTVANSTSSHRHVSTQLTREKVQKAMVDGCIMVSWINAAMMPFAKSWIYNLHKARIHGYIIGAMDDEALHGLQQLAVPTWRMADAGGPLQADHIIWGSDQFHVLGRSKTALIRQLLELVRDMGQGTAQQGEASGAASLHPAGQPTIIISDIDAMWLRNPCPFFKRYPRADMLVSTDDPQGHAEGEDQLNRYPHGMGAQLNIGIMAARPSALPFIDVWQAKLKVKAGQWDQQVFNDLVREGMRPLDKELQEQAGAGQQQDAGGEGKRGSGTQPAPSTSTDHLFMGCNGTLVLGVLPPHTFANGHMFFTQRRHVKVGARPYVAHTTYQTARWWGKVHRFREALLWRDELEYFQHPQGYISYDIHIPKVLMDLASSAKTGPERVRAHLALTSYQFVHVRTALLLASITGRALIMPQLWCAADWYWEARNTDHPTFSKPYPCPMDHVLDLEGWLHDWNLKEYGPSIPFRESSFLANPRLPHEVKSSRVQVGVCGDRGLGGAKAAATTWIRELVWRDAGGSGELPPCTSNINLLEGDKLVVAADLDTEHMARVMRSVSAARLLHFPSVAPLAGLWQRISNATTKAQLVRRLAQYPQILCCAEPEWLGWIWLDLLWDTPHTDRMGRVFSPDSPSFWAFNITPSHPDGSFKLTQEQEARRRKGSRPALTRPVGCTPAWKAGVCWHKFGAGINDNRK